VQVCENASLISLNDIVAGQVPGLPLTMFLSALLCKPTGPTGIGDVHILTKNMWTMPMLCSVFLPWKQCVVFLDLSCYRTIVHINTYHSFFAEIGAFFLPTATQSPFFAL
jgi:hypothetical protein